MLGPCWGLYWLYAVCRFVHLLGITAFCEYMHAVLLSALIRGPAVAQASKLKTFHTSVPRTATVAMCVPVAADKMFSFAKSSVDETVASRLLSLENAIGNIQPRVASVEYMAADLLPKKKHLRGSALPPPAPALTGHRGYVEPARGRTLHLNLDTPETR